MINSLGMLTISFHMLPFKELPVEMRRPLWLCSVNVVIQQFDIIFCSFLCALTLEYGEKASLQIGNEVYSLKFFFSKLILSVLKNSLSCHLKTILHIKTVWFQSKFLSAKLLFQKIMPNLHADLHLKTVPTSRCYLIHFKNFVFDLALKCIRIYTCIYKTVFCYKMYLFIYNY